MKAEVFFVMFEASPHYEVGFAPPFNSIYMGDMVELDGREDLGRVVIRESMYNDEEFEALLQITPVKRILRKVEYKAVDWDEFEKEDKPDE